MIFPGDLLYPVPLGSAFAFHAGACLAKVAAAQISFLASDGGNDCFSFSALSLSAMSSVYKYLLHRILNFVCDPFFLIFTERASLRRAICKNWRISAICFGMAQSKGQILSRDNVNLS